MGWARVRPFYLYLLPQKCSLQGGQLFQAHLTFYSMWASLPQPLKHQEMPSMSFSCGQGDPPTTQLVPT